jgi:hypothetical protein
MAIDEKYTDLINADIDGELSDADKAKLQTFLAGNAEARTLYEDLSALCSVLESVEDEEPPQHMRYVIMNAVKPLSAQAASASPGLLGSLKNLFAAPALRYATVFAAGVALTLSLVNSGQISNRVFDDVTGLVGTVANPVDAKLENSVAISETEVSGTVSLRSIGSMLILDFDLVAKDPIEIAADYTDKTIWFNGFAQLESSGTTISTDTGQVTVQMEGKRRYAVYLHNAGGRETTVNLRFMASGEVVHETSLNYEPLK